MLQQHGALVPSVLCLEVLHAPFHRFPAAWHGLARLGLELRVGYVDTDMARLVEESEPDLPSRVELIVADLEVNKPLPHQLRHVESFLLNGEAAERPCPLVLTHRVLQVDVNIPSFRVLGVCLQELGIDLATSIDVPKSHLQIRVVQEDALLLALGDGAAEDQPGPVQVELPDLELRVDLPDLRKGELPVRHYPDQLVVHLAGLLGVARLEFLE
mmetsp:Transcript_64234/g.201133  ORF Transcript_64234/g.201133 Transcript_64234/m.201133 type:complete len:214 (+) Transcript_64234:314-955(+)